jgi:N-acetylmuramoyl-L-alanine amidase
MRTTIFAVILASLLALPLTGFATPAPALLANKVIVLDPGHGGPEAGARYFGVREADINLAVGLLLKEKLTAVGATVVMTRSTDALATPYPSGLAGDLQARVDIAGAADADIYVSLHSNAHDKPETAGIITFYPPGRPTDLARAIQDGVAWETGAVNKGVRPANFYVLRHSNMPAVLVEMGFLTNKAENANLADPEYQQQLASGIFKGIIRYFLPR